MKLCSARQKRLLSQRIWVQYSQAASSFFTTSALYISRGKGEKSLLVWTAVTRNMIVKRGKVEDKKERMKTKCPV